MDENLTPRDLDVLRVYGLSQRRGERCPSHREVAKALGASSSCMPGGHLESLEAAGCIVHLPRALVRSSRDVRVTDHGFDVLRVAFPEDAEFAEPDLFVIWRAESVRVPVLPAAIAAGAPLHRFGAYGAEHAEGWRQVSRSDVHSADDLFLLRVVGDSMIDIHVADGDLALLRRTDRADDGDIVAVSIGGDEATLKVFRREGADILLCPENETMAPIVITAEEAATHGPDWLRVIGRLVGVQRDEDAVLAMRMRRKDHTLRRS